MNNDIMNYNNSLEYAVEYFSKAIQETIRAFHKKHGFPISHEEYIILETIHLSPGIKQIDIANKILMQRSYVGKLLNKLAELKYIERKAEIKGKRQIIYKNYLTKNGEKLYLSINTSIVNEVIKVTTNEQREDAYILSKKLIDLANKLKEDSNLDF